MANDTKKPSAFQSILAGGVAGGAESLITVSDLHYLDCGYTDNSVPNRVHKDKAATGHEEWQAGFAY